MSSLWPCAALFSLLSSLSGLQSAFARSALASESTSAAKPLPEAGGVVSSLPPPPPLPPPPLPPPPLPPPPLPDCPSVGSGVAVLSGLGFFGAFGLGFLI